MSKGSKSDSDSIINNQLWKKWYMKPPIKSGERKQWIENISLMFKKRKSQ